jgi:hypothetical protein
VKEAEVSEVLATLTVPRLVQFTPPLELYSTVRVEFASEPYFACRKENVPSPPDLSACIVIPPVLRRADFVPLNLSDPLVVPIKVSASDQLIPFKVTLPVA